VFEKVLVANRGEIAVRILRTLRRMGVASVALHSDADCLTPAVDLADEAIGLPGDAPAKTYLAGGRIVQEAVRRGVDAVHPGYGFLSENADFAEACAAAGITFIGPTPEQLRTFGTKHTARALAAEHGVPLLPGTGLLADLDEARAAADRIGFPVMLKSTAGGGGIGLRVCTNETELADAFAASERLGRTNFGQGGVLLERYVAHARHLEVQIFGDGDDVVALGERDCSIQRRHQKVVEEAPAPGLDDRLRTELAAAAVRLGRAVGYRSAGTVEFVLDTGRGEPSFLEVNTRLQVEHGVTEAVTGVDLVEWMVREAAGEPVLDGLVPPPAGHAIEVRLYAEDPASDHRPSTGELTDVVFPEGVRCDTWIGRGTEVTPYYDPLLAKLVVTGRDRATAVANLRTALAATRVAGVETNLGQLRAVAGDAGFGAGGSTTDFLDTLAVVSPTVEVLDPGTQSSIQAHPGRLGRWAVGVPPSGPMDDLSCRLANRIVGNDRGAATLELTFTGPTLRFRTDAVIALAGAPMASTLGDDDVPWSAPVCVPAGATLRIGAVAGAGARAYLAVRGGFDIPEYLDSTTTFMLGRFGGHGGRALRAGDVLHVAPAAPGAPDPVALAPVDRPPLTDEWELGVAVGPHGAPDFFTPGDVSTFFAATWEVHHHSDRTGVRLLGPRPEWARPDGGEAGLHPSNIHDNEYAVGTVDFTGDMPIVLGPDGPSLGGFVCPATVVEADLWKLGQLRAGDRVRFRALDQDTARARHAAQARWIADLRRPRRALPSGAGPGPAVLHHEAAGGERVEVTVRRAGDRYVLVEFGENVLDLALRFRVHALMTLFERDPVPGVRELAPGIRSLQVRYDPDTLPLDELVAFLVATEGELGSIDDMEVPSRVVHLPLSWDDPATQLAVERYMQVVRADAPWCPSNLEFIRRINGLDDVEAVREVVFGADYLVMGLGDVYLGAPVATPLDPRHRLVTTKYNPARTWTPENAVGIGGAYLCVYGMEGPGGYQLVGRTVQMWNRWNVTPDFAAGTPWLLRFFDQLRFHEVSHDELERLRADFPAGRVRLETEPATLRLADHRRFLADHAVEIRTWTDRRRAAFDEERARWRDVGEELAVALPPDPVPDAVSIPPGATAVSTPLQGSVCHVAVAVGDKVEPGDVLVVLEAMKTETTVPAPSSGTVLAIHCDEGRLVSAGQALIVLGAP
jgi:urea carboxylase